MEEDNYPNLYKELQKFKTDLRSKNKAGVEILDADIGKRCREKQHLLDLQKLKFEDKYINKLCQD